jgi:hypothetical protein
VAIQIGVQVHVDGRVEAVGVEKNGSDWSNNGHTGTPRACGFGTSALGRKSDIRPTSFGVTVYWSIDELLAHYFSVRPLLNGDLAHFKRSPVGMIGIDAVNNERLVA